MRTAIVIDDSASTDWTPNDYNDRSGYTLRAEIAIGEAYLRQDPDASIIGLNAGLVKDFSDLEPMMSTPQKEFIQAVEDYDRIVLIMDSPLAFNGRTDPNELKVIASAQGTKEIQIVLVMDDLMGLGSQLSDQRDHHLNQLRRLLIPHITMIVDPRAILDFGF
ncbi:hypothetical protein N9L01_00610 [bacterium]|nr:hypothetical protein [bacterium]